MYTHYLYVLGSETSRTKFAAEQEQPGAVFAPETDQDHTRKFTNIEKTVTDAYLRYQYHINGSQNEDNGTWEEINEMWDDWMKDIAEVKYRDLCFMLYLSNPVCAEDTQLHCWTNGELLRLYR